MGLFKMSNKPTGAKKADLISWAQESIKSPIESIDLIVETPWSTVLRLTVGGKVLYAKQTPPDLFIETKIIKAIQDIVENSKTPLILHLNSEINCYLMESCGDYSLRTKFNGVLEPELLFRGIKSYVSIQRGLESHLGALEKIGVPDWRIARLPELYTDLINNENLLKEEGLTLDEIKRLKKLSTKINSICEFLSKQPIKETLVNFDFNDNNLILNEKTQEISVVDLGESAISHPFLNIAAHLASLLRRYKLDITSPKLQFVKEKWLDCWTDVANKEHLDEIYKNISKILPITGVLALLRLQKATNNKSKQMQTCFIPDSLRKLLEAEVK